MHLHTIAAWIVAHPIDAALLVGAVSNVLYAALPARAGQHPRYGWAVRLLGRLCVLVPHDAEGTIQVPILRWPVRFGHLAQRSVPVLHAEEPGRSER